MTNTNSNIRVCKCCELTYFAVPLHPLDHDTAFALFSDEMAASMFADTIYSIVERKYHYVCIYK